MTEQTTTETLERVAFRKRTGKTHRGLIMDGRLVATCSCPGSQNGRLTNGACIVRGGWQVSNCDN